MSYTRFIAKRYLRSRRNDSFFSFITAIATLGVMLGTATLIVALCVLGGFENEITEKVVGFTGHVQIRGFQNQPLGNYTENAALIERTLSVVRSVSPFVEREALIRSRQGVDGILLKGIDPVLDNGATRRYIVSGVYDLNRVQGGFAKVIIGRRLAAKLAVDIGDKVAVFAVGRLLEAGQARVMQFRITGLYESGMSEYDDVYAFTDLTDAQTLFQIGHAVSGYDLMLSHADSAAAVADRIGDLLGYPHYARTVFQTYRNFFSWIELQKALVPIILFLIIVVATVNIIGTLLMMVLDKVREIGVLAALGATRGGVMRIFLRQGFTIALSGTALGNMLALLLCYLQLQFRFFSLPSDIYFMTSVPILMKPAYFLGVSVVSIALSMLSALIPARLAARLDPVNAIRFT